MGGGRKGGRRREEGGGERERERESKGTCIQYVKNAVCYSTYMHAPTSQRALPQRHAKNPNKNALNKTSSNLLGLGK